MSAFEVAYPRLTAGLFYDRESKTKTGASGGCRRRSAGCTLGPDFKRPDWATPASWFWRTEGSGEAAAQLPVAEPIDVDWWRLFHDPELTGLEKRVAAENLDVKTAGIRLTESRAQLGVARASLFPTLNGNASYVREQASNNGLFALIPSAAGRDGCERRARATRRVGYQAAACSRSISTRAVSMRLMRSICGAVSGGRSNRPPRRPRPPRKQSALCCCPAWPRSRATTSSFAARRLSSALPARTFAPRRQSLGLTQQRAAGGVTTDLDVANASAQLRTTLAQIPSLEQQEAQTINALSLLLGQPPNALRAELATAKPVPPVPPRVPVGLPSELARRRPDIRQAEAQLHAATADIGVAEANFYPSLNLTGSVGLQSLQFKNLFNFNSKQYALGPGLTIPIFEGGQLRSTLQLREAQQQEAAVNFQKTVLQAWHDVDNALTAYEAEQTRRDELVRAVAENQRALDLAQSRYQQGVADFLTVLVPQTQPADGSATACRAARRQCPPTLSHFTRRWAAAGRRICRKSTLRRRTEIWYQTTAADFRRVYRVGLREKSWSIRVEIDR